MLGRLRVWGSCFGTAGCSAVGSGGGCAGAGEGSGVLEREESEGSELELWEMGSGTPGGKTSVGRRTHGLPIHVKLSNTGTGTDTPGGS